MLLQVAFEHDGADTLADVLPRLKLGDNLSVSFIGKKETWRKLTGVRGSELRQKFRKVGQLKCKVVDFIHPSIHHHQQQNIVVNRLWNLPILPFGIE